MAQHVGMHMLARPAASACRPTRNSAARTMRAPRLQLTNSALPAAPAGVPPDRRTELLRQGDAGARCAPTLLVRQALNEVICSRARRRSKDQPADHHRDHGLDNARKDSRRHVVPSEMRSLKMRRCHPRWAPPPMWSETPLELRFGRIGEAQIVTRDLSRHCPWTT